MLPFGPTTPDGACTVFGKERERIKRERCSDEGEKWAREKTKVHRWEVEGKAPRKKDEGGTRATRAVERWWIE